jgi:hypothetical protein
MRDETIHVCFFLASADATSLVTDKLESNLQELISSQDRCHIVMLFSIVVISSILHDDVLSQAALCNLYL